MVGINRKNPNGLGGRACLGSYKSSERVRAKGGDFLPIFFLIYALILAYTTLVIGHKNNLRKDVNFCFDKNAGQTHVSF